MRSLRVAPEAEADFDAIVRTSADMFGEAAAHRYRLLIQQAYADLRAQPDRPASPTRSDIPRDLRLYDVRHRRLRVGVADRVGHSRHVIAYRYGLNHVEIVRILHDRMDLPGRLRDVAAGE